LPARRQNGGDDMTIQEAKNTVILAGKRLVETGLIARTWGNVSCRISDSHFVITPSGRDYLSLTPEEIVEVAISDCSYSGDIKPSSEKGVHAEVYKLHPEVNFVIHTHQENASVISTLMLDSIKVPEEFSTLRGEVICASYGLPGTKKLRRNVAEALNRSKGNAVIMKNHGALCFGSDYEEAFRTAHELEAACERFIQEQYRKMNTLQPVTDPLRIGVLALSKITGEPASLDNFEPPTPMDSERSGNMLSEIHKEIYKTNRNANYIHHACTPAIMAASCAGIKLLPLLDDFAQIAGISVNNVGMNPRKIASSLKGASAVLIKNKGALCCGISKSDAQALSMVLEKNCKAYIIASLHGKIKPINRFECRLMRFVYLNKYSKMYKSQK